LQSSETRVLDRDSRKESQTEIRLIIFIDGGKRNQSVDILVLL
jgi:hypothetical protein